MEEPGCEFDIVWLDASATTNLNESDYFNRKINFSDLINHLRIINDVNECLENLSTFNTDDKILLIISGSIGKHVLAQIHEQIQIIGIYIYCYDVNEHLEWASSYPKVRCVYNEADKLIDKIHHDVQYLRHHFIPASIFSFGNVHETSFQNIDREKTTFIWFQLLMDVLMRLPKTEQSRLDLIEYCRKSYSKNAQEQQKISDFEINYNSTQAIDWYTRDCFLFRLLNRACRTRSLDNMFNFRHYLVDLQNQLHELHETQKLVESSLTLYRGQILSASELQKLKDNIGGTYCVNSFFSTSISSNVALTFQVGAFGKPYIECVLFEITVDNTTKSKWKVPFADIHEVSHLQHEGEVLFGMGSVFRIADVTQYTPDFWLVNLQLLEDSGIDESLREYFLINDIGQKTSLYTLSEFLDRMGEVTQAKRYCELLLKSNPSDTEKIRIYSNLAYYEYKLDNLSEAKRYGDLAMQLQASLKLIVPSIYSHMGLISSAYGNYSAALMYHQMSADADRLIKAREDRETGIGYLNLGITYFELSMPRLALFWLENMALKCQQRVLPTNHPELSITYSNISEVYCLMGNHTLARTNLEKALQIQKNNLPPLHFDTHIVLSKLAVQCEELGEYKNALDYYRQVQQVIVKSSPPNQQLFAENYVGIAAVYDSCGNYKKALFYNRKALRYLSKNKPEHHFVLTTVYNNIGMVFINMKYYKYAMKNLIKALILEKRFLNSRHQLFLTTCSNIGIIYEECNLLKKAFHVQRNVLDRRRNLLERNHPDLATTLDNIGVILYKLGKFKKAIKFYKRALCINANALPLDHPATAYVCDHLGDAYHRLGYRKLSKMYHKHPERMARSYLYDRQDVKEYENEEESLTTDQSKEGFDLFTLCYIAATRMSNSTDA